MFYMPPPSNTCCFRIQFCPFVRICLYLNNNYIFPTKSSKKSNLPKIRTWITFVSALIFLCQEAFVKIIAINIIIAVNTLNLVWLSWSNRFPPFISLYMNPSKKTISIPKTTRLSPHRSPVTGSSTASWNHSFDVLILGFIRNST